MNHRAAVVFMLAMLLVLAGCTQTPQATAPPDTRVADQKAITDGEAAWVADWQSKDVDRIVSHYADDAVLMEADMPAISGKDAIRNAVKSLLADENFALTFAPTAVEASRGGDLAFSRGACAITITDAKSKKPASTKCKYATVYRKQADGSWQAILDISNADAAAR